jgi:hypothetical protein
MAKISFDAPRVGTLHPRQNYSVAGTLSSLGAEIVTDCDGCSSFGLDLRGASTGTILIEGTIDGVNWLLIPILPIAAASRAYQANAFAAGAYEGRCGSFAKIRARMSSAGNATVVLVANLAALDDTYRNIASLVAAPTPSSVGTALTVTIANPGSSLRHYITKIRIDRFATALLTASATPIAVTTTNLPSAVSFSLPQDAAAQGTILTLAEDYGHPLAASAQSVSTTLTLPATSLVIWRATVYYFLGP